MTARKTPAAKKAAAKKAAAAPAPSADLLPGELPGAVPFRHPVTGERITRRQYVELDAAAKAEATSKAWAEATADGKLVVDGTEGD